ncbi:Alpha/beta-hydrolase [Mycena venus]|uniref:Alpha/beta-hydrolase n=1 Tax=Mycena venus TaxID=2733690 RepID=A0A8H6Y9P6_9AGAR|nr:Alpha/beta-hydrolase [Mycena venus]
MRTLGTHPALFVVISLHGLYGVGAAPITLSPVLPENRLGTHHINPTLAGWGYSAPRFSSKSYAATLTSDMTELISHLHPSTADLHIYISGILYGVPFDKFPWAETSAGF